MQPTHVRSRAKRVIVAATLIAINLGATYVALGRNREVSSGRGEGTGTNFAQYVEYTDGSLWKTRIDTKEGSKTAAVMLRPATVPGLVGVWWPLAASLAFSLATAVVGLSRRREPDQPRTLSPATEAPI